VRKPDRTVWAAIALLAIFLVAGCGGGPRRPAGQTAGGKMLVAASILPMADFARQVGGDRVQVELMVPAGASEHTYEPTAAQLEVLTRAKVLVLNGVGLEFWADSLVGAAGNPGLRVVKAAEGLPIIAEQGEQGATGDPHVWLDPISAIHQVERIRDAFAAADPPGAATYRQNAARYAGELTDLDKEIRAQVATFSHHKFIGFHTAWAYFARRYGLEQVAAIERSPGREPSPAEVAEIVRTAKTIGAKAIFAEYQFPTKAADAIAAETGAKVLVLDPLGIPPDYSYIKTLRYDVAEIAKALR